MKKILALVFPAVILICLLCPPVAAGAAGQLTLPHAFYGSVSVNGSAAPDGTLVSATVDQGTVLTNAQNPVSTQDGGYGIDSVPLLVQGDIANGAVITFHVTSAAGTAVGGEAVFQSGDGPTRMDLAVTIAEPSPTHKPSGGGGGGGSVDSTLKSLVLAGLTASPSLQVDASGLVQNTTTLITGDGRLSLYIARGTRLLDAQGEVLTSLSAVPAGDPPSPPDGSRALAVYDLGPPGAVFEPPLTLSIGWDASLFTAEGYSDTDLYLAWWNGTQWNALDSTVDAESQQVSAPVAHFTSFALLNGPAEVSPAPDGGPATDVPSTTVPGSDRTTRPETAAETQPAPAGTAAGTTVATTSAAGAPSTPADSGTGWTLIILLSAAALVVIILVLVLVLRRRRSP